ncbi:fruit bromelain-like [Zerene cesonia]|uniref:fruit bromelain-like n=1 Tax=Zerene cesonia TaxID=33412 RepID=UPI0018E59ED1|nr:fruit bromelain-like [Zerene cesonia]
MMRVAYVGLLIIACKAYAAPASDKPHYNLDDAPALFEKFIQDYNKVYKDDSDRAEHYKAFVKSLEAINQANKDNTATFDINEFADYTEEQRKHLTGLLIEEK